MYGNLRSVYCDLGVCMYVYDQIYGCVHVCVSVYMYICEYIMMNKCLRSECYDLNVYM